MSAKRASILRWANAVGIGLVTTVGMALLVRPWGAPRGLDLVGWFASGVLGFLAGWGVYLSMKPTEEGPPGPPPKHNITKW